MVRSGRADPPRPADEPWHALDVDAVAATLGSSLDEGLDPAEAAARHARYGPNLLPTAPERSALAMVVAQFSNPLIFLLVFAALIALALGHADDATVIGAVLLINAGLGAFHEVGAARSIAALRDLTAPRARVRRAGRDQAIDAAELVPGDLLVLEAGDVVAADARLTQAVALRVAEATLTGESAPVAKQTTALPIATALADRSDLAHAGTHVAAGRGLGLVVAIGPATELGRIAALAQATREPPTPLERRIGQFARRLTVAAGAAFVAVVTIGAARGLDLGEILLVGMSQLVGMVPEGLPVAITVAFAVGVKRMARRQAIVRRLAAVQTLGEVSVICSDKTGTLTLNEMTATALLLPDGRALEVADRAAAGDERLADPAFVPERSARGSGIGALLEAAVLCNDAKLGAGEVQGAVGDPTEIALLSLARRAGIERDELLASQPRRAEIAFDPQARLMATEHATSTGTRVVIKGAPEVVLTLCGTRLLDGRPAPLDAAARASLQGSADRMAHRALRLLAFALVENATLGTPPDLRHLAGRAVLLGAIAQSDPPRPEAGPAVERCRAAGIRTVMVTGDHRATALAVADRIGITRDGAGTIDGAELQRMEDDDLANRVATTSVFCRVHPAQKLRIVDAYQARREVVAMTGDGVNDAPALMRADVGIAMGRSGTAVAREAAAIVLADDNFATVVAAVEEGRIIYRNVRKVVLYLLSTSVAEVLILLLALVAGLPPPLAAVQILWINLVTEGTVTVTLIMDPAEGDEMHGRPIGRGEPLLDRFSLRRMVLMTTSIVAVTLGWYWHRLAAGVPFGQVQTETFTLLAACQWFNVLNCRSATRSAFDTPLLGNPWLVTGLLASIALQAAVVLWPALAALLHTSRFALSELAALFAVASLVLWIEEAHKLLARRRTPTAGLRP